MARLRKPAQPYKLQEAASCSHGTKTAPPSATGPFTLLLKLLNHHIYVLSEWNTWDPSEDEWLVVLKYGVDCTKLWNSFLKELDTCQSSSQRPQLPLGLPSLPAEPAVEPNALMPVPSLLSAEPPNLTLAAQAAAHLVVKPTIEANRANEQAASAPSALLGGNKRAGPATLSPTPPKKQKMPSPAVKLPVRAKPSPQQCDLCVKVFPSQSRLTDHLKR